MDTAVTGGGADSAYKKESKTSDNAVDTVVETRETAPGGVESLHIGVVVDTAAARDISTEDIGALIIAAAGVDEERGDTVRGARRCPSTAPPRRPPRGELEAAAAADKKANMNKAAPQRARWAASSP